MAVRVYLKRAAAIVAAAACMSMPLFGCSSDVSSPDLPAHLISTPDDNPQRPIDSLEGVEMSEFSGALSQEKYRARVDELYSIVVDEPRGRPIFAENDPVKPVYDAAIAVLDKYIRNSWHAAEYEYNIVHTIHDYLVSEIDYDFDLYDSYVGGEGVGGDPAFDIDGVFLNRRAVCDGLSSAAVFLCAIEGIECIQVTGVHGGVPHAWNKVNVGGVWYNMDVTTDAANYQVDSASGYKKQLSHGYFLLSDETYVRFYGGHKFDDYVIGANIDYDYYSGAVTEIGEKVFPVTVTSQEQLNAMFSAVSDQKGKVGKLEVKLNFGNKENVNNGDMYAAEIAEAYSKLKNPNFSITATQKPYFQYPNGVYLFLMYL